MRGVHEVLQREEDFGRPFGVGFKGYSRARHKKKMDLNGSRKNGSQRIEIMSRVSEFRDIRSVLSTNHWTLMHGCIKSLQRGTRINRTIHHIVRKKTTTGNVADLKRYDKLK